MATRISSTEYELNQIEEKKTCAKSNTYSLYQMHKSLFVSLRQSASRMLCIFVPKFTRLLIDSTNFHDPFNSQSDAVHPMYGFKITKTISSKLQCSSTEYASLNQNFQLNLSINFRPNFFKLLFLLSLSILLVKKCFFNFMFRFILIQKTLNLIIYISNTMYSIEKLLRMSIVSIYNE